MVWNMNGGWCTALEFGACEVVNTLCGSLEYVLRRTMYCDYLLLSLIRAIPWKQMPKCIEVRIGRFLIKMSEYVDYSVLPEKQSHYNYYVVRNRNLLVF